MSSQSIDLTGASPPTGIPPPLVKRENALLPATIPREQTSEQNSYFLYKEECRLAWIKYLGLLGRAINTFIEDRDKIKYWESASSRNPLALLQSTQTPSGQTSVHKVIQYAMNRLVGIQTQEDDPPSCPGYVLPMASFERAVMNAQRTKDETQRRQWADMAVRSLRNFMDAQNNEAVIDKIIEFQKHYEGLAALSSK
ncbi:hypothetical protein FACUT_3665 [Fusarium acutatum]|uniref:Uncharacterized protein n=1 Tax=Fusarium acutatum TaxID=78861 RepID=A0A8H4JYG7_9HYPO|nr:hypothetical protein FACUT_3665 [Fusarium acutatum]